MRYDFNIMMYYRSLALSLLTCTVLFGCSKPPKGEPVPVGEQRALLTDYNDLVRDYNAQTKRNTESDSTIFDVTTQLNSLDGQLSQLNSAIESAYQSLRSKQCAQASSTIEGGAKVKLEALLVTCNDLMQDTLAKALKRISNDTSSYKEEGRDKIARLARNLKDQTQRGLPGLKSLATTSVEELIGRYHLECEELARPRAVSGAPLPAPAVPDGSVVTVGRSGAREVISRDALRERYRGLYAESAFNHFSEIASGTGGFIGFSPTAELFSNTVEAVLDSILSRAGRETDVAIVLDTTASMSDDIGNVKHNMKRLLTKLKEHAPAIGLRLSLLLYRDHGDQYVTQISHNFSDDIDGIHQAIQKVSVSGGGDLPEAVLDALVDAKDLLSWRSEATRSIVLIGDAPGHPKSLKGISTATVLDSYKEVGVGIVVYPIVVSR